jgi:hypothetical protein
MQMKNLISLILIFTSKIYCQDKFLVIIDNNTKKPIPYCTVKSFKLKDGSFANLDGKCDITNLLNDSVSISSIGYKDTIVFLNYNSNLLELNPLEKLLEEVVVDSRNKKTYINVGIIDYKKSSLQCGTRFGEEFALKMKLPDSNISYLVDEITIGMERFDKTIPMIIHLYNEDLNGMPDLNLLSKTILIEKKHFDSKNKRVIVNLKDANVVLKTPRFFVSVEWLPTEKKKNKFVESSTLIFTKDFSEPITYSRCYFYSKNIWNGGKVLNISEPISNLAISAKLIELN